MNAESKKPFEFVIIDNQPLPISGHEQIANTLPDSVEYIGLSFDTLVISAMFYDEQQAIEFELMAENHHALVDDAAIFAEAKREHEGLA